MNSAWLGGFLPNVVVCHWTTQEFMILTRFWILYLLPLNTTWLACNSIDFYINFHFLIYWLQICNNPDICFSHATPPASQRGACETRPRLSRPQRGQWWRSRHPLGPVDLLWMRNPAPKGWSKAFLIMGQGNRTYEQMEGDLDFAGQPRCGIPSSFSGFAEVFVFLSYWWYSSLIDHIGESIIGEHGLRTRIFEAGPWLLV